MTCKELLWDNIKAVSFGIFFFITILALLFNLGLILILGDSIMSGGGEQDLRIFLGILIVGVFNLLSFIFIENKGMYGE